MLLMIFSK